MMDRDPLDFANGTVALAVIIVLALAGLGLWSLLSWVFPL